LNLQVESGSQNVVLAMKNIEDCKYPVCVFNRFECNHAKEKLI